MSFEKVDKLNCIFVKSLNNILIVDCMWSEWQIGDCSVSCDGGERRNKRFKVVEERDGGKCEGSSDWQEYCNTDAYPSKTCIEYE